MSKLLMLRPELLLLKGLPRLPIVAYPQLVPYLHDPVVLLLLKGRPVLSNIGLI